MAIAIKIAISIVLGSLRLWGVKNQSFQAVAHVWVGLLIGLWWAWGMPADLWIVIGLSVIEVAAFLGFHR